MTTVKYPDVTVQLIGQDSNAFMTIGLVSRALRREVGAQAAKEFADTAMKSDNYDDLLRFIQQTVVVE